MIYLFVRRKLQNLCKGKKIKIKNKKFLQQDGGLKEQPQYEGIMGITVTDHPASTLHFQRANLWPV